MYLENILNNDIDNHIFPFFWQHGEDETTLRKYMEVIDNSNIKAVCVESRPHPDFAGELWWRDLNIIFDEAKKRGMKVWILDDSHFPSGFSNGALNKLNDVSLRRQFICYKKIGKCSGVFNVTLEDKMCPPHIKSTVENFIMQDYPLISEDRLLGFVALNEDGCLVKIKEGDELIGDNIIYGLYTSYDRGPHRDYINMCDRKSVRVFIDTVYEEHYKHYKDYFGNVLEGFFSDEPEIGNGHLYEKGKRLHELDDLPYSLELEENLRAKWANDYLKNLATVFVDIKDKEKQAKCRIEYMDEVTNLVKENFSMQIGEWCRSKGVKYIGHMIEDNNEHTRTGSSLGHFFRGLKGQSFAGIDDIGGQVIPQMEDALIRSKFTGSLRDGVFYHFSLGKLGSSLASIDSLKKGNAMCEVFGNYGWKEGVYLEKYLVDHFMVRGINYFVPHAFSPAPFPDKDCPPHFYAQGNNPQYAHFGKLMLYTNRVCSLISGGKAIRKVAVLYQAEADWSGFEYMKEDLVNRVLMENQIDFDIVPADIFDANEYDVSIENGVLCAGNGAYEAIIVPEYPIIKEETVKYLNAFASKGGKLIAINKLPEITLGGQSVLNANIIKLEDIPDEVSKLKEVVVKGEHKFIRYMHYQNNNDVFYFVNEANKAFKGEIALPDLTNPVIYDAWNNEIYKPCAYRTGDKLVLKTEIEPRKSLIVYSDSMVYETRESVGEKAKRLRNELSLSKFKRSICTSLQYPGFTNEKGVVIPDELEKEYPEFGGFVKYSTTFDLKTKEAILLIDDLLEGVEVFLNGKSLGIQVVPVYEYDLSKYLNIGLNTLDIISATTLERLKEVATKDTVPENQLGIKGSVKILW